MAVYVDDAMIRYGRMLMSHMIADSRGELLEMADAIGVPRRHVQNPRTHREHFDVCKEKRDLAIRKGAIPISRRRLVGKIIARRPSSTGVYHQ